jgi:hypothetical protein
MTTLKLIDEKRVDELIEKSSAFVEAIKVKESLTEDEVRMLLIMEGQLLAYKMVKDIVLKVVPATLLETLEKLSSN